MCGIIGYYCFGDARPSVGEISTLLQAAEYRGWDATGIGYLDDHGALQVQKAPMPATRFVETLALRPVPPVLIGHTRAATSGHPGENMNNHPLFTKTGLAVVHNGIIGNDRAVLSAMDVTPDGQVDSEAILRVMDAHTTWEDRVTAVATTIRGSYALAALDAQLPGTLCLIRHQMPIAFSSDPARAILWYASTQAILSEVAATWRGLPDTRGAVRFEVGEDTAVLISPQGCTLWTIEVPELSTTPTCVTGGKTVMCDFCWSVVPAGDLFLHKSYHVCLECFLWNGRRK